MYCFPMVFEVFYLIMLITYIYCILGSELFGGMKVQNNYSQYTYADFSDLLGTFLLLFQVLIEEDWTKILNDYGTRANNLSLSMFYFFSYHLIT